MSAGAPSYEMLESDPDWAPSLHLGHVEVKETSTGRHNRLKDRATRKQTFENMEVAEDVSAASPADGELRGFQDDTHSTQTVQTDITSVEMVSLTEELQRLQEENRSLTEKLHKYEFNSSALILKAMMKG